MSQLAPGRTSDMSRLMNLRARYARYSRKWNDAQLKIDDLVAEGRCPFMCHERERLVNAARAGDNDEIIRISEIINQHMRARHRVRYTRAWLKKG